MGDSGGADATGGVGRIAVPMRRREFSDSGRRRRRQALPRFVLQPALAMSDDLSIQGTLAETTVPDLFRSLVMSGETGIVTLEFIGRNDTIYFSEGHIVAAASSDARRRRGQISGRLGQIRPSFFARALKSIGYKKRRRRVPGEKGRSDPHHPPCHPPWRSSPAIPCRCQAASASASPSPSSSSAASISC